MANKLPEDTCPSNGEQSQETMALNGSPAEKDVESGTPKAQAGKVSTAVEWDDDASNPLNWPARKKALMLMMMSSSAILASLGTSIVSPARTHLMDEFGVSSTVAILPLTLYTLALGFGPVLGGPLSETVGRYPVYLGSLPLGALFTLGAGFTHNFGAMCFLRFLAGFCWGPVLAVATGSLSETFRPKSRGPASALFILMPFLGPGLGPVIGSFVVNRKGWRWTQWTLIFFAVFSILLTLLSQETFHPALRARLAKRRGEPAPKPPPLAARLRTFAIVALVRPIRMLFLEPIVAFICLYVAAEFGTLFSFFAGVPYTFGTVYGFGIEPSGLVFVAVIIGCVLGLVTVVACDALLYRPEVARRAPRLVAPEHRLYPAMVGSAGLPLGLFWFAWTARAGISWASPAAAMISFAWGNMCVFVSTIQYTTDTYHGNVVASAGSANSLARYGFAAVFPLFTIQMYEKLGVGWASSLLGFISVALMPIPWVLFKFGPRIRAKSQYETVKED